MARYGIALRGPHKGEYTKCRAHDLNTCVWHSEGSHKSMTRNEMLEANEAIIHNEDHDNEINSIAKGKIAPAKPYSMRRSAGSKALKAIRRSSVILMTMIAMSGLAACGNNAPQAYQPSADQQDSAQVQKYYEKSKDAMNGLKDKANSSNTVQGMKEDWKQFKQSDDYKNATGKMKAMMEQMASGGGEVNSSGGQSGVYADIGKDQALQELSTITITPDVSPRSVGYNRKQWNQDNGASWAMVRGRSACWNVRDQVIADQGQHVTISPDGCKVIGSMTDPYSGVEDPVNKIQIDHSVPLGYAAAHGAQSWSKERKQQYANDMTRGHLVAADGRMNMQKSDKGPSDWMPSRDGCGYAKNFADVLYKWQLSTTQADHDKMLAVIQQCAV